MSAAIVKRRHKRSASPERDRERRRLRRRRILALRKRRASKGKRRGIALIMVLGAITVLTVFLTELQQETFSDLSSAIADRDRLQAEYHARSAVNLGRLVLATEPTVRVAIMKTPIGLLLGSAPKQIPVWEKTELFVSPFNDEEAAEEYTASTGMSLEAGKNLGLGGEGSFRLVIVDESAKLNLNSVAQGFGQDRLGAQILAITQPPQYNPLFEQNDIDDQLTDRATLCGALVDWADPDEDFYNCEPFSDSAPSSGVEDSYYQTLGLPYQRKNAAFDSLEEVRLIRGVGDDFWATFVDPAPEDPKRRIMTVWGQEQVNINAANGQTLLALVCALADSGNLCQDPEMASNFISLVELTKSIVQGVPFFKSPKQFVKLMTTGSHPMLGSFFESMGIEPVVFKSEKLAQDSMTVQSKRFSIYAEGVVPGYKRETRVRVHAVVALDNAQPLDAMDNIQELLTGEPAPDQGEEDEGSGSITDDLVNALGQQSQHPGGTIIYWRVE